MITCKSLGHYGRFGNQLYQIAGIIGIARKNQHNYSFPLWRNYDHLERFGSSEDIDLYRHLESPLPELMDIPYKEIGIGWGYHDVQLPDGAYDLSGHFQSPRYFNHCMDEVRERLKFTDEPEACDYIAVHYRAGDYDPDPNAYHPRMSKEYYQRAKEHFPNEKFLVFSDNIDEAKQIFNGAEYFNGKDYIEDYKKMKSCKGFIISNSTFSSFAATIKGGKTVAPRKWFGPVAGITGDDVYKENWIVI